MLRTSIFLLFLFALLPFCNYGPDSPAEALIGEWETVAFRVKVSSAENRDSSYVIDVSEEDWEMKLGFRPIVTTFSDDNKYIAEYTDLEGQPIKRHRGLWNIMGDTLVMIEPDEVYQYRVTWDKEFREIRLRSRIDYDDDGAKDDQYEGTYRKR